MASDEWHQHDDGWWWTTPGQRCLGCPFPADITRVEYGDDGVLELAMSNKPASMLERAREHKAKHACPSCNHPMAIHGDAGCPVPQEVWGGAGYKLSRCGCGGARRKPKALPVQPQSNFGDLFEEEEDL